MNSHDRPDRRPELPTGEVGEALEVFRSIEEAADDLVGQRMVSALQDDDDLKLHFDRLKRWDRRFASKLEEVETPFGLENRLLDALEKAADHRAEQQPVHVSGSDERKPSRWFRRRRAIWSTTAAAALLLLAIGWWWSHWNQPASPWTPGGLVSISGAWLKVLPDENWRAISERDRREFPPLPGMNAALESVQRFKLPRSPGEAAVYRGVYGARRQSVLLFVIRSRHPVRLPEAIPPRPRMATSGWVVASWKSAGLIYVLRVHGSARDYQAITGGDAPLALRPDSPPHLTATASLTQAPYSFLAPIFGRIGFIGPIRNNRNLL